MKKIEDYCIPDLVGTIPKWIFVLESPHKEEIRLGYPAAGESGGIMSEVLLGVTQSIGQLLKENNPIVGDYAVMNASCIPLQEDCYNESHLRKAIAEISKARRRPWQGIAAAKNTIKSALDSQIGKQITNNLNKRVMHQLESNPHGVFIVCGVVAQSIFEAAMNVEGRIDWFHKSIVLNLEGKETTVFYEYHPSNLSGRTQSKWKDKENIMPLLRLLSLKNGESAQW